MLLYLGDRQVDEISEIVETKIRKLQHKHRSNPAHLQRAIFALYARHGTSPFAGCLPTLAQAAVFIVLYGLFLTTEISGQANALLTHQLAGVPLG